jgi:hypothetical protein
MPASLLRLGGWRSVGALVVVAAAATGIGQTGAGHALLEKADLIQRPTGYTALYFGDPTRPVAANPVAAKPPGKRVSYTLRFFVHNAQSRSQDYRWSLLLVQRPGHARPVKSQSAAVGPGKTVLISHTGKFTCDRDRRVEFIVQLAGPDTHEAIHAWTTCQRRS